MTQVGSQSINNPFRQLAVFSTVELVVCGGGPAGFIAATSAARMGIKTILLEQHGFLGGMATAAMVGPMSKFNLNGQRIVGGIPLEFINAMHALGGAIVDLPSGNIPYDAEIYKLVAQRFALSAGVDVLVHAQVVDAVWDRPGHLTHVVVETKSGRLAIATQMLIDTTGTGDLLSKTELPWIMRNQKGTGNLQPMSLYFRLGGVATDRMTLLMAHDATKYSNPELRAILAEEVNAGRLQNFGGPWAVHGSTIRPGEVSVNATRYAGNASNARDLSNAELALREEVHVMVEAFRKHPAFRNCYLIDTAPQVGIRETRSVIGLYTLSLDDILRPGGFADTVAKGGHPVDIHQSANSQQHAQFITEPYDIPYRSLVPVGSENLLVGGGLISATPEAFGSVRVQAQCMALGQAAGTAAALCVRQQIPVTKLDGAALRESLKQAGAIV